MCSLPLSPRITRPHRDRAAREGEREGLRGEGDGELAAPPPSAAQAAAGRGGAGRGLGVAVVARPGPPRESGRRVEPSQCCSRTLSREREKTAIKVTASFGFFLPE